MTALGYIQLSGTSFAAPVVAGAAQQILVRHPSWTPDQVKGALLSTAKKAPNATPNSLGAGELYAGKAAAVTAPPNPLPTTMASRGPTSPLRPGLGGGSGSERG